MRVSRDLCVQAATSKDMQWAMAAGLSIIQGTFFHVVFPALLKFCSCTMRHLQLTVFAWLSRAGPSTVKGLLERILNLD